MVKVAQAQRLLSFAWREGRALKADANEIGKALSDLAVKLGRDEFQEIESWELVDEARDPSSIFHPLFEWDNDRAAHEHRLDQARRIFSSISFQIISPGVSEKQVIAYVSLQVEGRRAYMPTTIAARNAEFTEQEGCTRRPSGMAEAVRATQGI